MTGEFLRARKSLMRVRIDLSIVYPTASAAGTKWTSFDSLLGDGRPLRGRAIKNP